MDEPKVLTVMEAGKLLRLSRNGAYAAAKSGELPTIRIGRKLLVPIVRLNRLLAGDGNIKVAA